MSTAPAAIAACCPRCRRRVTDDDLVCGLCGEVLRRAPAAPAPAASPFGPPPAPAPETSSPCGHRSPPEPEGTSRFGPPPVRVEGAASAPERIAGLPPRAFVMLVGLALAPVLTFTPLLRYMGWFLGSLVHETGHVAAAFLCGCPAFPGIRLDGHAAAVHRDQVPFLCAAILLGLVAGAWKFRRSRALLGVFVGLVALYPFVAFTRGTREGLFLSAGHLGELAFAGWALWQAVSGGFSGALAERCAHAAVGWYLVGRNAFLGGGLLRSNAARIEYLGNGSFGLENDLIRLSRDVLGISLAAAGGLLLLASLGVALLGALRAFLAPDAEEA